MGRHGGSKLSKEPQRMRRKRLKRIKGEEWARLLDLVR
jgi:hypothetical protein